MSVKGDLGVELVSLELMRRGWTVLLKYGGMEEGQHERQGCDLIAKKKGTTIVAEVKLRDDGGFGTPPHYVEFSEAQLQEMTHLFVVVMHLGSYEIFLMSKSEVDQTKTGKNKGWIVQLPRLRNSTNKDVAGKQEWDAMLVSKVSA